MFRKVVRVAMNCCVDDKNPNCILNALIYPQDANAKSSGLGRYFSVAHDGRHVRGVEAKEGNIITLEPLTGTVVYRTLGSPEDPNKLKGNRIIDIRLDKYPYVAIYKDLLEWKVEVGQYLRKDTVIGTILGGAGAASGFHFTLIRQQFYKRYREITRSKVLLTNKFADLDAKINKSKNKSMSEKLEKQQDSVDKQLALLDNEYLTAFDKWFVDPIGAESPVNCPSNGKVLLIDPSKFNPQGIFEDNPMGNEEQP